MVASNGGKNVAGGGGTNSHYALFGCLWGVIKTELEIGPEGCVPQNQQCYPVCNS